jgi:hypothetical protein
VRLHWRFAASSFARERFAEMEQYADLLAVRIIILAAESAVELMRAQGVPAGSRLAPLTLESSNALLPPLSSHLRSGLLEGHC